MADKKRILDVWIVEINKVYREVPYTVVLDWLQQGRLLPEDKVRLAGGKTWHLCQSVPAFEPFLPRAEPAAARDQAEALAPVDLGFVPTRRAEDEDEDVDMIPLIDISLVLLIFFMMTATVSSGFLSPIDTPGAKHQLATPTNDSLWLGIDSKSAGGQVERDTEGKPLPWYNFGKENMELLPPTTNAGEVLDALSKALADEWGDIQIRIRADRNLPIETIKGITMELQGLEGRLNKQRDPAKGKLKLTISGEVSEPAE
jgi:biopolymer transport protein ExbD